MAAIIDYRTAGATDGQVTVSAERAGDSVVVTVDLGDAARQPNREALNLLTIVLAGWIVFGGVTVARGVSGKEWIGFGAVFGGGAALLLWFMVVKYRALTADVWWRFTASPAGLLVERQNRGDSARWQLFHPRGDIKDATAERIDPDGAWDAWQVCVHPPDPQRLPLRYLDLRRQDAEMLVNAIREGLRL